MGSRAEVMNEVNTLLETELGKKVPIVFTRKEKIALGKLDFDELYANRKGCLAVYWTRGNPKNLGGCCCGNQVRQLIIDCYGTDRETADVLMQMAEDTVVGHDARHYRVLTAEDQILHPEALSVQGDAVRLIIAVSHMN